MACSACFSILSRTTCLAVAPFTETWALFLQSLVKKMRPHTCLQAISLGDFLKWGSSCKIMPVCIKLAKWNTTKQNKIKKQKTNERALWMLLQGNQTKGRCWEFRSVHLHLIPFKHLFHWEIGVRKPYSTPLSASGSDACSPRYNSSTHSFLRGRRGIELRSSLLHSKCSSLPTPSRLPRFSILDFQMVRFYLPLWL